MSGTNLIELSTLRISPRVVLRRGDHFKVSKGPQQNGHRCGERGEFQFLFAYRRAGRVFVEALKIEAGMAVRRFTLFVGGEPFQHASIPGRLMAPYGLRRVRRKGAGGPSTAGPRLPRALPKAPSNPIDQDHRSGRAVP